MTSSLGSFTALPNLHPALVHFPIALAFAGLALDLFSLFLPRWKWLERAAAMLYTLAAAGAVAAYLAGRQAAGGLGPISVEAEAVLSRHADMALWAMIVLLVAAFLRLAASMRVTAHPSVRFGMLRLTALAVMLGAAALVGLTADLGGALVFQHGVAVAFPRGETVPALSTPAPAVNVESPEVRLSRGDDGSLNWRPVPGDVAALGSILKLLPGSARVSVVPDGHGGEGLGLQVKGEALLVLPGTYDGLAAVARLDLSGFEGTAGVAYHVADRDTAVFFTVSTGGEARLFRRSQGAEKVFDTESLEPVGETVELRATVAGHHLKGFINGKMAVHGHGSSGQAGRVGLYLDGQGTVRVLRLGVRPAGTHRPAGSVRKE